MEDESMAATSLYLAEVNQTQVLPGPELSRSDLANLRASASELNSSLESLAELIASKRPATFSRVAITARQVHAYVTADDVELQLESHYPAPPFDLEIAVAVYDPKLDSNVPQFERNIPTDTLVNLVNNMKSFTYGMLEAARTYGTELSPEDIVKAARDSSV